MCSRIAAIGAGLAVVFTTSAFAQRSTDAAFTATGQRCEDVRWSDEALEQYPNIATACREVMERDGRYYVRFEGEVRRVRDRGNRITIAFEGGDTLTLTPPENLSLTIDGRERRPSELRPGDELTFYVPEDQLTATFFAGQPETSEPQEVPISPTTDSTDELLAQADDDALDEQPRLPRTAGFLPFVGAGGLALLGLGGILTFWRRMRGLAAK